MKRTAAFGCAGALLLQAAGACASEPGEPLVRMVELTIDPARLDAYKAILAEEQRESVRREPGVIMLHSVSLAEHPDRIRLLEVYASQEAYETHLKSHHFLRYKRETSDMVRTLTLLDAKPVLLCSKRDCPAP